MPYIGNKKILKVYQGNQLLYSSGNTVTYYVDSNVSYQERVDYEATCLSPTTFTPSKSGYTFVGWREDKTASSSVVSSKVMGNDPINLYAVFKKTITLSYNGNGATGGSTASQTGTQYYNNGNVANPSFTLKSNGFSRTDHQFVRYRMNSVSGTAYNIGASVTLSENTTFYVEWKLYKIVYFSGI